MFHFFDVDLAKKYGVNCAILIANFDYWISKNKANNTNFYDGRYWTFNSKKAFSELFPYRSEKQIRTTLDKLIDEGLIITGNYNVSAYDRTLWYAFTEKGESICLKRPMDKYEKANGIDLEGQPIPNNKPNINTDIKEYISKDIFKKVPNFHQIIKEFLTETFSIESDEKFEKVVYDFAVHRKEKKAPLTDNSLKLNLNKAYKLSNGTLSDCISLIETAIANGWQGIYKDNSYNSNHKEFKPRNINLDFDNEECKNQLKNEVIPF